MIKKCHIELLSLVYYYVGLTNITIFEGFLAPNTL